MVVSRCATMALTEIGDSAPSQRDLFASPGRSISAAARSFASLAPRLLALHLDYPQKASRNRPTALHSFPATLHHSQAPRRSQHERGNPRFAMMALPPPPFPTRFSNEDDKATSTPPASESWPEPGATVQEQQPRFKWSSVRTEQEQYIDALGEWQRRERQVSHAPA